MSPFNQMQAANLSCMYEGDKARDATPSIRGFLFQDLVVINYLLEDDVEYVCSECLEDVDVFYKDNRFRFIQVKYYPKTSPKMEEISTDLYYQYLRLRMLDSGMRAIPTLYVHAEGDVLKPSPDDIREYMLYEREEAPAKSKRKNAKQNVPIHGKLRDTAVYPNAVDVHDWLKKTVHFKQEPGKEDKARSKGDQKDILFAEMAASDSLEAFLNDFVIIEEQEDIKGYKKSLMERLARKYGNPDQNGNEENWQLILLGLALSRVQEQYLQSDRDFDSLWLEKNEFTSYMKASVQTKTERTIVGYLVGVASEVYENIVANNSLDALQMDMLNEICRNTVQWIHKIGVTMEGQYQLLNTLSKEAVVSFTDFENMSPEKRLDALMKWYDAFVSFLSYLWKIWLNLCRDKVKKQEEIHKNPKLFDIKQLVDSAVKDYVCVHFPEDHVNTSIILPPGGGQPRSVAKQFVQRFVDMEEGVPKPEKWFFQNYANRKTMRGRQDYSVHMANIKASHSVAAMEDAGFYIECMNCIDIEWDSWGNPDPCGNCIFSEKCCEGGN